MIYNIKNTIRDSYDVLTVLKIKVSKSIENEEH
jgi:hypothetical protein